MKIWLFTSATSFLSINHYSLTIMNSKILRLTLLSSATISIFVISETFAAGITPKAGARCSTQGEKIISRNLEFTCIKRGSILVWNNGVKVKNSSKPTSTPTTLPVTPSSTPSSNSREITRSEVSAKNSRSECWSIIKGKVYDLTTWIRQHPGGEEYILDICGKDGTSNFSSKHGSFGRPISELAKFLIGNLKI